VATKEQRISQKYLDLVGVIIVAIDADERVKLINKKGCEILGYKEGEIVGKNWFENFIPERNRDTVRDAFTKLMAGKIQVVEHFENPVLAKSGEERMIAWHNAVLDDEEGRITGTLSSGTDITEHQQNEEILRRSEAEIRAVLDTVVDGIITIDHEGTIQSFNPAAARMFGYPSDEVIGQNLAILMPEPDSSQHDDYLGSYLHSGEKKIIGIGREVIGRRKDGTTFPMYLAVSEVHLRDEVRFTGIVRDLTDFKQLQEKVLQAQSLATIGEMAASIAHEIKNPLAGISGAIQVLKDRLEAEDPHREIMEEIVSQVRRLDNRVRELLMLSKPWQPEKQLCDVRSLIEKISATAQEQESFAQVQFILKGEKAVMAPVDPTFFEQVIWNVLHNASQAMPDGGEIRYSFAQKDGFVLLTVADTGTGIPKHQQDRIFRPFYTTKTRGTGLGLAICQKIMQAQGGSIAVSSEVGRGTEVTLSFPH
jgi:two-component system sensor kinase FixL